MAGWTTEDIPDQSGRVAVITGANSGIGYEAALALAAKGAHVVIACRNLDKGRAAFDRIGREVRGAALELAALDLDSLASVQAFAAQLERSHTRLDLLINNAGMMAIPERRTEDGFEMQFGVNHLAHFALTGLLMPTLLTTRGARVVSVSSSLHTIGQIDFDDLNRERGYSPYGAYGQSKLANLLFAYELQRRFESAGVDTLSVACHPGFAATRLTQVGPQMSGAKIEAALTALGTRLFGQSAANGALPTLYAATDAGVNGCDYIGPKAFFGMRGAPGKVRSNARSYDETLALRLWDVSEALTSVHFDLLPSPSAGLVTH